MAIHYRLTARAEEGELAELHQAIRVEDDTPVVVKLFHTFTSDPAYAREVVAITQALDALQIPAFVRILDLGVVRGRLAIVREAVNGPSLGMLVQRLSGREQHLPVAVALALVIELAEAVQLAHEAGVLHGALTPGNVLLTGEGLPRIADFGAMRALLTVPALRRVLAPRGRVSYRAPEADGTGALTPAADIYSLGAIAYELLTLQEPVRPPGSTTGEVVPPSRVELRLPSRLDPLILKALEPSPGRRYRSSGELAAALRSFVGQQLGGMPGSEGLHLLVRELFPGDTHPGAGGAVLFPEAFTLTPVEGVTLPPVVPAEPQSARRAAYSRRPRAFQDPEDLLPTQEAGPELLAALESADDRGASDMEDPLDATYVPKSARDEEPEEPGFAATHVPRRAAGGGAPVDAAEEWEAPPAAVPLAKPKRSFTGESVRHSGRHPRVKVIEDFQPVERATAPGPQEPAARVAAPPASRRVTVAKKAYVPEAEPDRDSLAEYEQELEARKRQKVLEEEQRQLEETRLKRRRDKVLGAAVGAALLLTAVVGMALYLEERSRPVTAPPPAIPLGTEAEREVAPEPADPRLAAFAKASQQQETREQEERAPKEAMDVPPRGRNVAYLTVKANLPAVVYVDGKRVKGKTPLVKYPVRVAKHRIEVEAIATGERKGFDQVFRKGKVFSVEERFTPPPTR